MANADNGAGGEAGLHLGAGQVFFPCFQLQCHVFEKNSLRVTKKLIREDVKM